MALSRIARLMAAEIKYHDWSDAPFRADRAGHRRELDTARSGNIEPLKPLQTDALRMNVMWVVGQVLWHEDPNFDCYEFAEACGVDIYNRSGGRNGGIAMGFRRDRDGRALGPVEDPDKDRNA